MRFVPLLFVVGSYLLSGAAPLTAQDALRAAPGSRVRVTLASNTMEGTLIALTRDSLVMFQHPAESRLPRRGSAQISLPLSAVTSIVTLMPPVAPPIGADVRVESQVFRETVEGSVQGERVEAGCLGRCCRLGVDRGIGPGRHAEGLEDGRRGGWPGNRGSARSSQGARAPIRNGQTAVIVEKVETELRAVQPGDEPAQRRTVLAGAIRVPVALSGHPEERPGGVGKEEREWREIGR